MVSLDSYLACLRNRRLSYAKGLERALQFTKQHGGTYHIAEDDVTVLKLGNEVAYCFQPYADIDQFYYEI